MLYAYIIDFCLYLKTNVFQNDLFSIFLLFFQKNVDFSVRFVFFVPSKWADWILVSLVSEAGLYLPDLKGGEFRQLQVITCLTLRISD